MICQRPAMELTVAAGVAVEESDDRLARWTLRLRHAHTDSPTRKRFRLALGTATMPAW